MPPPFPFLVISPEDRDKAFFQLQALDFKKGEKLDLRNIGNKASNYYFQKYRVKTKSGKWSQWDRWNDPIKRAEIIETDKKIHRKNKARIGTASGLSGALRMSGYSINQFKPYVAVYIYQLFRPSRVLDITAGWGDRLVGALSQNIDYIGIDSNQKLKTPYKRLIDHFSKYSNSKVKMIFAFAEEVDYDELPPYDLIFTSPPYFFLERYEGMKDYGDRQNFNDTFFIPAITGAYKRLTKGGHLALNMPKEMKDSLVPLYGEPRCIELPIQNRFAWISPEKRFECIYIWQK